MAEEFLWVAIAFTSVVSASRITRLFTHDVFPPIAWLREKLVKISPGEWATLWVCPYCFAMYSAIVVLLWGYFVRWDTYWWLFNGWMAISYLAATYMVNDGED